MVQLQKWVDEFGAAGTRIVALTTDSPGKNRRIAERFGIEFAILSDPKGSQLKALDMWDERFKIARHGFILLDRRLNVVSNRRGSWSANDAAKAFLLEKIVMLTAREGREGATRPEPGA
ncbi:MAG: redoxin domain-containing protein [SAR324 cluster bacterium]|nr:redoxin domain-containing protein [SAR324 cluster bacterium]